MTTAAEYVGIDVSKRTLDVSCGAASTERFLNEPEGFRRLIKQLKSEAIASIILEATGGYERALVAELVAAELPVVVVNPRQVRSFAKATGRLAKTDAIDAVVLAEFGHAVQPPRRPLPNEKMRQMQEKISRRRQLVQMRTAESNRRGQAIDVDVQRSIDDVIAVIDVQLQDIDQDLDRMIRDCPAWREKEDLLQSVPGVGPQTARALIANLPELGHCSRQQIAALAGVAPMNRDSGHFRGRRTTIGGRADVRRTLYMATLVATRWNPVIRTHYQRLLQAGKQKKLALVACMRKLLCLLNAMLRDQKSWKFQSQIT